MTRVGVVGPVFPDSFADNIVDSLRAMGHEPISLGPATRPIGGRFVNRLVEVGAQAFGMVELALQQHVISMARNSRPELVISIDAGLLPRTVEALRTTGARVALWFPDALGNLGRQLMFLAPYDLICFKDPVLVLRTRRMLGTPAHYLPEACNPSWHRPPAESDWRPVVVIAGNMYPTRIRLLERLARTGLPLELYGPRPAKWLPADTLASQHTGSYIARSEKAKVFRSAAVVLNTLHPTEMESMNCRLFEAAGCGAAVLTEYRAELPKLFEIGEEVVAFSTFDELVQEARSLLADPERSRAIGDRAALRAHRDHSYGARLSELMGRLLSGSK